MELVILHIHGHLVYGSMDGHGVSSEQDHVGETLSKVTYSPHSQLRGIYRFQNTEEPWKPTRYENC